MTLAFCTLTTILCKVKLFFHNLLIKIYNNKILKFKKDEKTYDLLHPLKSTSWILKTMNFMVVSKHFTKKL